MIYKTGQLLLLSTGEYSDYDIHVVCRVLKNFDSREVSLSYNGKRDDYDFDDDAFTHYLTSNGYIEDVDYQEWHLGSYGTLDIPEEAKNAD